MDTWVATAEERHALADVLEGLTAKQWETPSLCGAWTVHALAVHLVLPLTGGLGEFAVDLVRARGNFHRASELGVARGVERLRPAEVVARLRGEAHNRFRPPTMPPEAPLAELLVHGQDLTIPLGIDLRRPVEHWRAALGFLTGSAARRGFVHARLPAVRLVSEDVDWSHGSGPEVDGTAREIGVTLAGRDATLDRLSGPGVPLLEEWVRR